jgi:hypothetical protein
MRHEIIENAENGGYPYQGWYNITYCNNVLIEDCYMSGHRRYRADNNDTDGDGILDDNTGTWMGTYDIYAELANNITWKNCKQVNEITNGDLWGVMGANLVKNLTYDGCSLSRFDAHQGVHNATVKNSEIGLGITVVGTGTLTIENTIRYIGDSLVELRTDYGATWDGPVIIRNCTHNAYKSYDPVAKTGVAYTYASVFSFQHTANSYFGYKCYLFTEVTVDNVIFPNAANDYLFYAKGTFTTDTFTDATNPYQMPTKITVLNQAYTLKLCNVADTIKTKVDSGELTVVDTAGKLTLE